MARRVSRTQYRPLLRGAITPFNAVILTFILLVLFVLVQYRLPLSSEFVEPTSYVLISLPFLAAIGIYCSMKRVTSHPKAFLWVPSSLGNHCCYSSVGDWSPLVKSFHASDGLYLDLECGMNSYNLVYAFQEVKDYRRVGVKLIAAKHSDHAGKILMMLATLQSASLLALCILIRGS